LLIENAANNLPAWAKLLQLFCTAQREKQCGWGLGRKKMLKKPKQNPSPMPFIDLLLTNNRQGQAK